MTLNAQTKEFIASQILKPLCEAFVEERSQAQREERKNPGYEFISDKLEEIFSSLPEGDYPQIKELMDRESNLYKSFTEARTTISLSMDSVRNSIAAYTYGFDYVLNPKKADRESYTIEPDGSRRIAMYSPKIDAAAKGYALWIREVVKEIEENTDPSVTSEDIINNRLQAKDYKILGAFSNSVANSCHDFVNVGLVTGVGFYQIFTNQIDELTKELRKEAKEIGELTNEKLKKIRRAKGRELEELMSELERFVVRSTARCMMEAYLDYAIRTAPEVAPEGTIPIGDFYGEEGEGGLPPHERKARLEDIEPESWAGKIADGACNIAGVIVGEKGEVVKEYAVSTGWKILEGGANVVGAIRKGWQNKEREEGQKKKHFPLPSALAIGLVGLAIAIGRIWIGYPMVVPVLLSRFIGISGWWATAAVETTAATATGALVGKAYDYISYSFFCDKLKTEKDKTKDYGKCL